MDSGTTATIAEIARDNGRDRALIRTAGKALGVAFFVALTVVAARTKVFLPFSPVPMTLQPMAVLLAGAILGPWLGASSQVSYLALGACGVPAFAGIPGAGLAVLMGPTGGYLMSYPAAAFISGRLATGARRAVTIGLSMVAGLLIIYAFGVSRLLLWIHGDPVEALRLGVAPFVVPDLVKIAVASTLVTGWRSVVRHLQK